MADTWKKVESNGAFHNFDEEKELVGIYVQKKEHQGDFDSTKIYIKKENGEVVNFFANSVLDDRMTQIQLGDTVKIVYMGKKKSKTGRMFKDWEVFSKPTPKSSDSPDF
jgi:hypothetical protein